MAGGQDEEAAWEDTRYTSWDVLRDTVKRADGVLRVEMWELRELEQAGRLGVHVRASISRRLQNLGLSHLPGELPSYQEDYVVLYELGTAAADVVEAVTGPVTRKAERALRRLNRSRDAEKLLAISEKIAELADLLKD